MSKKNKIITSSLLVAALFILSAASVFAKGRPDWVKPGSEVGGFINSAEQKNNVLIYKNEGNNIKVIEPNWPENGKHDIKIGTKTIKEVKVKNNNNENGWLVVKVEIPAINAKMEGDTEDKVYDQFVLNWNTPDDAVVCAGVLVFDDCAATEKAETAGEKSVYFYGLNRQIRPKEYTPYLFTEMVVPFASVAEEHSDSVDIDARYIPATNPVRSTDVYNTVKEAFEYMGEFVPEDYTRLED